MTEYGNKHNNLWADIFFYPFLESNAKKYPFPKISLILLDLPPRSPTMMLVSLYAIWAATRAPRGSRIDLGLSSIEGMKQKIRNGKPRQPRHTFASLQKVEADNFWHYFLPQKKQVKREMTLDQVDLPRVNGTWWKKQQEHLLSSPCWEREKRDWSSQIDQKNLHPQFEKILKSSIVQ